MILGGKLPGKVGRCRLKKNGLEKARLRLHGQAVKTPPFHGGNPGSIPGGVTRTCAAFLAAFELYAEVAQG